VIRTLQKIGVRPNMMYAAGVASIGLTLASWLASYFGERAGTDRADRWALFIGEWAPTFFAVGVALRIEEAQPSPQGLEESTLEERSVEYQVEEEVPHPVP